MIGIFYLFVIVSVFNPFFGDEKMDLLTSLLLKKIERNYVGLLVELLAL